MNRTTPKPWRASDKEGYWMVYAPDNSGVAHVAPTSPDEGPDPEAKANAFLIAASPEVLEALKGIVDIGKRDLTNPKYDGYFESAKAAIAKAEQQ